jgi:hypothetical protein
MEIASENLRRLWRDWETRRHARFPRRADFDPSDFRYILGAMSIFEVCRQPLRFRLRLHGTAMVRRLGHDLTGKFVDEAPNPEWAAVAGAILERTVNEEACFFVRHTNRLIDHRVWNVERLILPLSASDGQTLDMVLSAFDELHPLDRDATPITEIEKLAAIPAKAAPASSPMRRLR